jgi:hypothetical protein
MASQVRLNIANQAFIRAEYPIAVCDEQETVTQIAARSGDIAQYTVMAKYTTGANAGEWAPYDDVTDTDGRAYPAGILLTTITEAAIKAADVAAPILVGGAIYDTSQLVLENSYTLDTVIATGTVYSTTIDRELRKLGLYAESTIDIQGYENT